MTKQSSNKRSLDKIVEIVESEKHLKQVSKGDLHFGDLVIIKTQNSVYSVRVLDDGFCFVSGGVFDRKGLSPMKTSITGCTWGGSAIKLDIVAACGMFLEFGNGVVTSRIEKVRLIPSGAQN